MASIERTRSASLSPPPLPAKSGRPLPHHVQSAGGRPSRGSFDVGGDRTPMDHPDVRRTAGSTSGQTTREGGPPSGSSSQATTRNNSIASVQSMATVHQQYAPAPTSTDDPHSTYAQRALVAAHSSPTPPPFAFALAAARTAAPSSSSTTAASGLFSGAAGQYAQPTRASVSAYDAKAIYHSFDTLPPLPSLPTSQNPHPAPDPAGTTAQYPHPSHPTSALSSLFLHVLPCFNGNPLRNPIESLNALVTSHITATFARYSSPARVIATLTADLRDILGSGMLTLESKLHSVEDDKLVGRVVEVWVFFWTAIVPYIEGIFLPLILDTRIVEVTTVVQQKAADEQQSARGATAHAIDPRLHLLTLFLVALLHPHLPRILPLLIPPHPLPSPAHLARLQQMALILLTQSDPLVTAGPETVGEQRADAFQSGGAREGLEQLLRSVGAASRARVEGGFDQTGSAAGNSGVRAVGLGSTPVKKAADNRRGGWIAGKHRRGLSQANAQLSQALHDDCDPQSPTATRSPVASVADGGTAKNEPSHLRTAQTPRQTNVFRSLAAEGPALASVGGASSFATATPTYVLGSGLRARSGADEDAESEAGYIDSLRSPELPWSGAWSPTQSHTGPGDYSDAGESEFGDDLPGGRRQAADGKRQSVVLPMASRPLERQSTDGRRHSSPPTVSDQWAAIPPGTAS